jgi:hypothetical protein
MNIRKRSGPGKDPGSDVIFKCKEGKAEFSVSVWPNPEIVRLRLVQPIVDVSRSHRDPRSTQISSASGDIMKVSLSTGHASLSTEYFTLVLR